MLFLVAPIMLEDGNTSEHVYYAGLKMGIRTLAQEIIGPCESIDQLIQAIKPKVPATSGKRPKPTINVCDPDNRQRSEIVAQYRQEQGHTSDSQIVPLTLHEKYKGKIAQALAA